jgi:hypothetical protein
MIPGLPITNDGTALFWKKTNGDLLYLDHICVSEIQFNPVMGFRLIGALPFRQDLITMLDGEAFELYYTECGPKNEACINGVLMHRFVDCKIDDRRIPNAVEANGNMLRIKIAFTCDIETPNWGTIS